MIQDISKIATDAANSIQYALGRNWGGRGTAVRVQQAIDKACSEKEQRDMTREELLKNHNALLSLENMAFRKRIEMMGRLLDEAIDVFDTCLNTPEAKDLKQRWEQIKSQ